MRTRITLRPASSTATASSAENTTSPEHRAGRRRQAARDALFWRDFGSSRGWSNCSSCTGSTRISAVRAIDQLLLRHLDRDTHRGLGRALAVARLQHEELAALDGEFHVLHVAEMLFEPRRDFQQLAVDRGKAFLERGDACALRSSSLMPLALGPFAPGGQADLARRANAGDHVLALRIGQKLAVDALLAGGRIAREGDAGRAVVAEVAEHHRLHGDRGAPVARDVVELAVGDRAIVVPRAEHRADRLPQLLVADPAGCRGRRARESARGIRRPVPSDRRP